MVTERDFLKRARLNRRTLKVWIEEEWLIPGGSPDAPAFTDMDLARAELIHDLQGKMGVNDEGLGVILHLLDQMHALRRALAAALESARDRRPSSGG
jgi:chaperone modulatory protein CbpM